MVQEEDVNDDPWSAWPAVNNDLVPYSSATVRKLELETYFQEINLRPLQSMFPNVSYLNFRISGRGPDPKDFELLKQIWESWPLLVKFEFSGVDELSSSQQ